MKIKNQNQSIGAIGYVIFYESIWSNLIKRQVIDIIISLKKNIIEKEFYLISFISWRVLFKERNRIKHEKLLFKERGIRCVIVPIPFPTPRYNLKEGWKLKISYNIPEFIVIIICSVPVLMYFKIFKKISLFHCRSYLAAIPVV